MKEYFNDMPFFNDSEKMCLDTLIERGWKESKEKILIHEDKKFIIDLNSYPIVQLKEDGKQVQCYHGISKGWVAVNQYDQLPE